MKNDLNTFILTKQELKIMNVVWDKKEVTVKDVHNAQTSSKKLAYTTIATELTTLERKGALICSKKGKSKYYQPLLSRRQATINQTWNLIKNYFEGDPEKLVEFTVQNMYDMRNLLALMYSKGWEHSMNAGR